MSQVSVVVLSIGEACLQRALDSLDKQTVPVREVIRVEHVHPFSRAFNQGAAQVKTSFFLQLDADMVLDPDCIQRLLDGMEDDCALTVGHLRDPMLGVVVGVKLFRSLCVQQQAFPETISSDTDWLQRVTQLGWKHRYVTDESLQPCPCLGAHEPDYNPNYIFCKYARWAAAYWNEGDLDGIRNHLRTVLHRGHPGRWWGVLGFAEGLARPATSDTLVPYAENPRVKSLENFMAAGWSEVQQPAQTPREAHALGYSLGRVGRLVCSSGELDWAFALGVSLGLLDHLDGSCSQTLYPLAGPKAFQMPVVLSRRTWLERAYPWLVRRLGPPSGCTLPPPRQAAADCSGVAYFMWQYPCETFVEREIKALRQAGLKLQVLAQEGQSGPPPDLELGPSSPDLWRCLRMLLALRYAVEKDWELDLVMARQICWLAEQLKVLKVRLIHSTWANPCALMALLAARLAGIACTTQVRAHEINRVVAPDLLPTLLEQMDGVCTNSAFNARLLGNGARVIYNGLDLENFPHLSREFRPCPLPFRILSVARRVDPKGLDTLLRACHTLRRRGIELVCTIVGGCEEPWYTYTRVELARLRTRLQLEDCVAFVGSLPFEEVLPYYGDHHVFCLPAQVARDGSHDVDPNCILEAMATGLPIVTTPIGAIPEQVADTALLVEPGQPEQLAAALEKLWREPDLARQLSEQAEQRCRRLFSSQRQSAELIEFFRRIGGGR